MTIDPERLEELLAREPYLHDDGFTEKVMAELPPGRRRARRWILAGSVGASLAVGFGVLPEAVQAALIAAAAVPLPAGVTPGYLVAAVAAVGAAALVALVASVEV